MRKISKILLSVVAVLTLALATVPALASTIDDLQVVDGKLSTATQSFYYSVSSASATKNVDSLNAAVSRFKTAVDDAKVEYARIATEAKSDGWRQITDKLTRAVNDMSDAASAIQAAIAAQDEAALAVAGDKYDTAVEDYNQATDEANNYMANNPFDSGDTQWTLWFGLLIVSVVCLAVAIAVNFLTRNQHGVTTGKDGKATSLKDVRRNILIGAGVFVVGAAIPAVQYYWGMTHRNADGTFEYYIFWYPLAIGAIMFVAGAFQYITVYLKVKKTGTLAHAEHATEVAGKVPKIGSKVDKK
ncbi:hypothetical protein FWH58_01115 [Candidatus Saccharibacteria bacterium]|nr:hypothetical protein [Candidatus Saccharibacteria bacterium]